MTEVAKELTPSQEKKPIEVKEVKQDKVKSLLKIIFKNTPNKQLFVEGTPNTEFEVINSQSEKVVGGGKTTSDGKAIVVCSEINQFLSLIY